MNDESDIFQKHTRVNYEDPYRAISLPVFSIHGNHDDPTRDSGHESLAAMDLLSITKLVNYFGKCNEVDNIEITPILLRKQNTVVALYGLGAIRDERLNRMWNQKKVKFVRPTEEQGRDNFFVSS
jgi:double-strand break repair protein MRE11